MRSPAVILLLGVIAAGCGAVQTSGPVSDNAPTSPVEIVARIEPTTQIRGGTAEQQELVREILSGLGPSRLESVSIVTAVDREWGAPENAVGIESKADRADGYAGWQGEVVGEVFTRRSLELGLAPVAYIADEDSASAPGVTLTDPLSEQPLTQAEAQKRLARVVEVAKKFGASSRVRVLKPNRLALAIELRTESPAAFLAHGLAPTMEPVDELHWQRYDGRYLKVVDGTGARVLEAGAGYYVRRDLAGCSPYLTLGSAFMPDPPCPVK